MSTLQFFTEKPLYRTVFWFRASGTFTAPRTGQYRFLVFGGGGSGGHGRAGTTVDKYATGGGAGGFAVKLVTLAASDACTITVGAGGTGVADNLAGNAGGASSVVGPASAFTVTANGGSGGATGLTETTYNGGAGGTATGGDINHTGGRGGNITAFSATSDLSTGGGAVDINGTGLTNGGDITVSGSFATGGGGVGGPGGYKVGGGGGGGATNNGRLQTEDNAGPNINGVFVQAAEEANGVPATNIQISLIDVFGGGGSGGINGVGNGANGGGGAGTVLGAATVGTYQNGGFCGGGGGLSLTGDTGSAVQKAGSGGFFGGGGGGYASSDNISGSLSGAGGNGFVIVEVFYD